MIIVRDSLFRDVLEFRTGEKEVPEGWHRADPTDILELSLYFRFPEVLAPVVPKVKLTREWAMPKMKETGGTLHLASDDVEYFEATPVVSRAAGSGEVVHVKRFPWQRMTPKNARPGRARRTRLWEERLEASSLELAAAI